MSNTDQQPQDEEVLQEPLEDGAVDPDTEPAAEQEAQQPQNDQQLADLQKKLDEANARAEEYLGLAQRRQADYENYRRRSESAAADARETGKADVAKMMLPVLDNLERAVAAADTAQAEQLKSGVELTLRQLRDAFTKLNVTPIDRTGEEFDPHLENAVMQGTPEDGKPGTVCQVLQKGYMMGKNVIRPAMVKVVPED